MARSYTQVFCSIWDDDDFCKLTSNAQHAYLLLITQGNIAACGTLALTLRRWSRLSADIAVDKALAELEAAGYIAIDADTEELFVRTFAKWDGGYTHTLRRKAVIASARAIKSSTLRSTAVEELAKLGLSIDTDKPLESHSNGAQQAPDSPRFQGYVGDHVLEPEPATHEREPAAAHADDPLSPFCPPHQPDGPTGPCGDCGTRRVAREYRGERQQRETAAAKLRRLEAIAGCDRCNENGFIEGPAGELIGSCAHSNPLVAAVGRVQDKAATG